MAQDFSVVSLVDDHVYFDRTRRKRNMYLLKEETLRNILMRDGVKDLPVAVVSVAGAFRGGKSFLLNYFIRYLKASESARANGSWVGVPGQKLDGFSWVPGSKRDTSGILLWPEPFIIRIPSGEQVAVLLMDTQGTFDNQTTIRDNSTVFALSTLLSSVQIFNLKHHINESDILNLELFTKYGTFLKDNTGKAFQELKFLVRDWVNNFEFEFGEQGGRTYMENQFQVTSTTPDQIALLHEHINASFEKVSCFLMPFPGENVSTPAFKEYPEGLKPVFLTALNELAHTIFSPEKLAIKMLGGQPVRARELFGLFRTYVDVFNSDELPEPQTICEAQLQNGLLIAANAAREQFESNMSRECALSMPAADLVELFNEQLDLVIDSFKNKLMFANQNERETKAEEIRTDLRTHLADIQQINEAKTLSAVTSGTTAYDAVINTLSQNQQLCVHATQLEEAHEEALTAATRAFSEIRKPLAAGRTDPDKQRLINICQSKYIELKQVNQFNNMAYASEIKNEYNRYMMVICNQEPKLNDADFYAQHERALARALEGFEAKRNRPNQFPQDSFKDGLKEDLNFQYDNFKRLNESSNARLLQLALLQYYQGTVSVSELRNRCLHPDNLKRLHEDAVNSALQIFRPGRPASEGFNTDDPDEMILKNLIDNHYDTLVTINNTANESAMEEAFEAYKKKFDELTNYFGYFAASWTTAKGYHAQAFQLACDVFKNRRRHEMTQDDDRYLSDLEEKCVNYYNPNNRDRHRFVEVIEGIGAGMEQISRDEYLTLPDD